MRVRGWTWTVERWLRRVVVGFPLVTACQVAAVRVVDPPFTLTMVQRVVAHARETGELAWPDHERRSLAELGENVPRAFVASEDGRFFLHGGFDFDGICHAVARNAEGGHLRGGSSITQQVAKNVFLWQGRSWLRKGLEVWYTVLLEALLPKERILELYLDVAETGPMTFGAEAGARHWFGRPAKSLSLEEAGRLAGILPDPRDRGVTGTAARERSAFVLANPAPFPEDPWFASARESWRSTWHGPWQCL